MTRQELQNIVTGAGGAPNEGRYCGWHVDARASHVRLNHNRVINPVTGAVGRGEVFRGPRTAFTADQFACAMDLP